jgi:predicted RNA binding protein with dsRBD fold (UPF0201 family)
MPEIRVAARCYPTEDRAKVVGAIASLFPDAVVEGDDPVTARADDIETFAKQLARQQIRAAARKVLRKGMGDGETRFRLNKQVATQGKVSFSDEDRALGDIEIVIIAEDIAGVIDRIAPRPPEEVTQ